MNAVQNLHRLRSTAWLVCAIAAVACALGAWFDPSHFWRAYLLGYIFWLGLALGSLALLMLYHLVGGGWALLIRRGLESAAQTLPIVGLMFVPILFGLKTIYPWARPGLFGADPLLAHKAFYLSTPFFIVRVCLYFSTWIVLAWSLRCWGGEHDFPSTAAAKPKRLRLLCGWGLVLYTVVTSFAAIDWVMSLDPQWFSTVFGMLFIVGQMLAALAALILLLLLLSNSRTVNTPPDHQTHSSLAAAHSRHNAPEQGSGKSLHDLGNLLLAFTMVWAYLAFVQFLIIWMGNLHEEIPWYLRRSRGIWPWLALVLLAFHFVVPFAVLLFRAAKRNLIPLASVAGLVLLMRFVDYLWQMGPEFPAMAWKNCWVFLVAPLAVGGAWVAVFARQLQRLHKEN